MGNPARRAAVNHPAASHLGHRLAELSVSPPRVVQCALGEEAKGRLRARGLTPYTIEHMDSLDHAEEAADEYMGTVKAANVARLREGGMPDELVQRLEATGSHLDHSILRDMRAQFNLSPQELVKFVSGGQVRVPGADLFDRYSTMAAERRSSHYRNLQADTGYEQVLPHMGMNPRFLHHVLFGKAQPKPGRGGDPAGFTFIQPENTSYLPTETRLTKAGHILDTVEHLGTGWNIGPHGTSPHTDVGPMNKTGQPDILPDPNPPSFLSQFPRGHAKSLGYFALRQAQEMVGRRVVYAGRRGRSLTTGAARIGGRLVSGGLSTAGDALDLGTRALTGTVNAGLSLAGAGLDLGKRAVVGGTNLALSTAGGALNLGTRALTGTVNAGLSLAGTGLDLGKRAIVGGTNLALSTAGGALNLGTRALTGTANAGLSLAGAGLDLGKRAVVGGTNLALSTAGGAVDLGTRALTGTVNAGVAATKMGWNIGTWPARKLWERLTGR